MTAVDTVLLEPVYAWVCPGCRAPQTALCVPLDEDRAPQGLVRTLRRQWQVPPDAPLPPSVLHTAPTEVTCSGCGAEFFAHRGELNLES